MFSGRYSHAPSVVDTAPLFGNWRPGPSDPLQAKVRALINYCYPNSFSLAPDSNDTDDYDVMKRILTGENLKHFLQKFKNFHIHWPMIHMPSFNLIQADDGLVLAMVCIGAIYSDRLDLKEVRWLMERVRSSVHRSSLAYRFLTQKSPQPQDPSSAPAPRLQEIQALTLLHVLFVWHGDHKQRQQGRDEFWVLVEVVRLSNLLERLPPAHPKYSSLHNPGTLDKCEIDAWTWSSWVEQEQRARTMYLILLMDAALTIFFNVQPHFNFNKVRLLLPADDAAWDARSSEDCAKALGLRGTSAQACNATGSKRPKQVHISEALDLLQRGGDFPVATNIYSKFILVQAILVEICNVVRQYSCGTTPPLSPFDRASNEGTASNASSERVTPVEGFNTQYPQFYQKLRVTVGALDLWKKIWDADMQNQYPPNQHRVGFCRDGIHFYHLATVFLKSKSKEWAAQADIRCQQVFNLLKRIRTCVATESAQRGLNVGSVATIDDSYGVGDLTLDMKLLFTPIAH